MQPNSNEMMRVHIWVTGRVQGVGFRAHVEHYAAKLGVSGWVRNVGRDTVEAVAEGLPAQVEPFILMVKTGPRASRVDEVRLEEEESLAGEEGFVVKRSL